jgi:hypothetical protein
VLPRRPISRSQSRAVLRAGLRRLLLRVGPLAVHVGCAPAFDDRHDLLGFRIAAVGVVDGEASAAVWSGALFHEEPVTLDWTADGESLGQGWGIAVPDGTGELGLVATAPDGTIREARVGVGITPAELVFERASVLVGDDISIEARAALEETPSDGAAPEGEALRIRLVDPEGEQTRWMVAGGASTLLELDAVTADVLPQRLEFDDGEVVGRETVPAGFQHILALRIDGDGGNRWRWVDAALGTDTALIQSEGWLLESSADVGTGLLAVTLDELTTSGVGALGEPEAVDDLAQHDPPNCAPADTPFSLGWLADGRCTVSETRGRRVVLAVR